MSGGGGSSKSTQTVQNYSPAEARRRAKVMDEAERIYGQSQAIGPYPGAEVTPFSGATLAGQQSMLDAGNMANQSAQQMQQGLQYGLTGAMDVDNNPYFQSALAATLRPYETALTQGLQQVGSTAQQQGAYGGGRHGVAEALAFDKAATNMGDVAARMGSDAYNQGQDTFARTLALGPQTLQSFGQGGQYQSAVGAQQENLGQQQADYDAASRLWDINAPWMPLENYANIVFGAGSSQSKTTGKADAPARNPIMGAMGGAMAGYAMGAQIGSIGGPMGAIAGGILGALF